MFGLVKGLRINAMSLLQFLCFLCVFPGVWVEDVVLNQEDGIKDDWHHAEHELNKIESAGANHWFVKGCCIQEDLSKTKDTASKVQKHVCKGPTHCAFAFVVKVNLRNVLDKCDRAFGISRNQESVPTVIFNWMPGHLPEPSSKDSAPKRAEENDDPPFDVTLLTSLKKSDKSCLRRK